MLSAVVPQKLYRHVRVVRAELICVVCDNACLCLRQLVQRVVVESSFAQL